MALGCTLGVLTPVSYAQNAGNQQDLLKGEEAGLVASVINLRGQGKYRQAIPLSKRVLEIRTLLYGPEHVALGEALDVLAGLHRNSGSYEEALPLYQRSLAIKEKKLGPEHPDVGTPLNNMALLYHAQGKYREALPLYQRSLAIKEKALGKEHLDVGTTLDNMALLYYTQGKYEQALPLNKRSLAIKEKLLGQEHPNVATALNNMGMLYYEQGKYGEALPLYQRSLAIKEKALGKEHPSVAYILFNMARLYYAQGKYEQAMPLYQHSLAIEEKTLGHEHPFVALILNHLAELYRVQHKYERALPLYQRSLVINEKVHGRSHLDVASSLNGLALLFHNQGEYEQALPLYQRSLAIREKVQGRNHPELAPVLNNLAELYRAQGKYKQALPLYQRSLAIKENNLGRENPGVALSLNNLALLLHDQGEYEQALPLYQRSLAIREKVQGSNHRELVHVLNNLAAIYRDQGNYEQASAHIQRSLAIMEKALGPQHLQVARVLNNLAAIYTKQKKYEQSLLLYQRSLVIKEKVLGYEHPDVALTLNNLAGMYMLQGDDEQASPLIQRSLAVMEAALGNNHPYVAMSLNNLAQLYKAKGKHDQAFPLYQRGLAVLEKALGKEHPDVAKILNNMADLYWVQGQIVRAVGYFRHADAVQEYNVRAGITGLSETDKHMFMTTMTGTLYVYIIFAIQTKHADADQLAAARLLRHKGRVLDDTTTSLAALRRRAGPDTVAVLAEFRSVRSQYATQLRRGPGQIPVAQHRANLQSLQDRMSTLERDIAKRSKPFRLARKPVTVAAVQNALGPRTALVEWVRYQPSHLEGRVPRQLWVDRPRYVAMVLKPKGHPQWFDLGDAAEIDNLVHTLHNRMNRKHAEVPALAQQLYTRLMAKPMAHIGPAEYLYLAPDAVLNQVPFAALMDEDGRYLIETHGLSYLTSGRDLLRMAESTEPKSPALIVADPDYGQPRPGQLAFQPIPKAAEEANSVQSFLPGAQVLRGAEAREQRIIDVAAPEVLHVATHGQFLYADCGLEDQDEHRCDDAMLKSSLAFAGANLGRDADGNDGLLTAHEVMGMNLFGTKLVVLSACDTGLGDADMTTSAGRSIGEADGLYGLRRAFVVAGAESQMVTLWKIDAYTTLDILAEYYRLLKQGMGRSEALRHIQLDMIRQGRHPYRWAGFILSGNPAAMDGTRMPGTAEASRLPGPGRSPRGCGCRVGHAPAPVQGSLGGLLLLVLLGLGFVCGRRSPAGQGQAMKIRS